MDDFIRHIERYLGKIQCGWTKSSDGTPMPFQVVACKGGIVSKATALLTLGLSRNKLASPASNKQIRQELLLATSGDDEPIGIPSVLQQVGLEVLRRGVALLRGDVIGPRGTLFPGSALEAIYVTMPIYYPVPFGVFEEQDGSTRVVAWLVPITSTEAAFVKSHGWREFEGLLERKNPDLLDIKRASVAWPGL